MSSFDFQIPGLTDREEDVADAFFKRMHEIAMEEGVKLDIYGDGGPVLMGIVKKMLPDYDQQQQIQFMTKVMEGIFSALELHKKTTEGSA